MCGEDEDREREREIKGERENEGGGRRKGGRGRTWLGREFSLNFNYPKKEELLFHECVEKSLSEMMFDVGCGGEGGNDICCFCINSCWNKIVSVYSV